jgi:hypothetical protein
MIVDDFDLLRAALRPSETDAPLVIDSNAPLSRAISLQKLEPIARRYPEIVESPCGVQQAQLAKRYGLNVERQAPASQSLPYSFGLSVAKADDHPLPS